MEILFRNLFSTWWGILTVSLVSVSIWIILSALLYKRFFKRLYDIIVCTEVKAKYFIKSFPLCSEHYNRHRTFFSYFTAYRYAVFFRHHNIKYGKVYPATAPYFKCSFTIQAHNCIKTFFFKIESHKFTDIGIVISDKNCLIFFHGKNPFHPSLSALYQQGIFQLCPFYEHSVNCITDSVS